MRKATKKQRETMTVHLKDKLRSGTGAARCGDIVRRTVAFSNVGVSDREGAYAILSEDQTEITCPGCTAAKVKDRLTADQEEWVMAGDSVIVYDQHHLTTITIVVPEHSPPWKVGDTIRGFGLTNMGTIVGLIRK